MKFTGKKAAVLGLFTAAALIMFIVESLFPPLFFPGAKMGLSNIFTLLALIILGPAEAAVLIVVRTCLGCIITGNVGAIIYSLSAGLASVFVSTALFKKVYPKISLTAISAAGAVVHNIVQTAVFCLIAQAPAYFAFAGYLTLIGGGAGLIVGVAVTLVLKTMPENIWAVGIENQRVTGGNV